MSDEDCASILAIDLFNAAARSSGKRGAWNLRNEETMKFLPCEEANDEHGVYQFPVRENVSEGDIKGRDDGLARDPPGILDIL